MTKPVSFWFYIVALISPFMGAMSYVLAKYVIYEISPISLLFYRWTIALAIFTPFVIMSFIKEYKKVRENIVIITIVAISGVTLFNLFLYSSLRYTTSTNAAIVTSVFPIFVLLLGVMINKEKLKNIQIFSIFFSLIGALVIVSRGHLLDVFKDLFGNMGDFLALAAAICYAVYFFSVKRKPQTISFYVFVYATFLIGTILIFPLYLFDIFYLENSFVPTIEKISIICFLGFGVSIVGMVTLNLTILKLGSNTASILFYLTPFFTAIFAVTILDEKFETFHIVGMILILCGVNLPVIYNKIAK